MTEAEWLACADPAAMLELLGDRASERALRQFACACARSSWGLLTDARSREAVEIVERTLDGHRLAGGLRRAEGLADHAQYDVWQTGGGAGSSVRTPEWSASLFAFWATKDSVDLRAYYLANRECMQAAPPAARQAALLREVVGNPFRAGEEAEWARQEWITATSTALAEVAYQERALPSGELDPARLAVLGDALEEAGCAESALLKHLREPGPHVRGCWVVDLLLGKV